MDEISTPREPKPAEDSTLVRRLTLVASALTAASIVVNLILQIARFLNKRPVEPDQRDKVQTAGLVLRVLRDLRPLIHQIRLLSHQIKEL